MQQLRWCDMALPSWVPIFPMLGSWQYPRPSSTPSLQVLMALTSRRRCILAWVYVDNTPIEPWRFLSAPQSDPNSSLIVHHCYSKWKNSSSLLGIRSLKESQLQLHKSLKKASPLWIYEAWFYMSKGHVVALLPIFPLHHPTSSWDHSLWRYWQLWPIHSLAGKPLWNIYL